MSVTAWHFWSPTCAPCKAIKPAIEDLKEEFTDVKWVSINTHDDRDKMSEVYSVTVVPTIVVTTTNKEGEVVSIEKQSGTTMSNYYRIIRNGIRISKQ